MALIWLGSRPPLLGLLIGANRFKRAVWSQALASFRLPALLTVPMAWAYFTAVVEVPGCPPSLRSIAGIRAINDLSNERDRQVETVFWLAPEPFPAEHAITKFTVIQHRILETPCRPVLLSLSVDALLNQLGYE